MSAKPKIYLQAKEIATGKITKLEEVTHNTDSYVNRRKVDLLTDYPMDTYQISVEPDTHDTHESE